jgi:hypothetical protein
MSLQESTVNQSNHHIAMQPPSYPIPPGLYAIPDHLLDTRPDTAIDEDILSPKPVTSEKNIWFFWHSGYASMHPYTKRNVRAWHRRLSKQGWTVRVIDRQPDSPFNVARFLDTEDPENFPRAFIDGTLAGDHAAQHVSDLVRWPLLLQYGGVYTDVGMLQIGDLDRLWNQTIGDPSSRFDIVAYNTGGVEGRLLQNYFLAAARDNPLFRRAHRLLLALWASDGGKTSTKGMHRSSLLAGVPLMGGPSDISYEENGRRISHEEAKANLTDYIIQCQALSMVMGLVDEADGWNGPEYVAEHVYGIEYMEGSQLINEFTMWNGPRAFELMSLSLPKDGEVETSDQKLARDIVEGCLQRSFGFKLAHGMIIKVFGDTLGSLWRKHEGSDDVPGTYAHWLRHATAYWNQEGLPSALEFKVIEPFRKGRLLG